MPSFAKTIIQSALLKSAANLTAQVAAQWQSQNPHPIDWQRVAEFAVFGLIQAQLSCWWQQFLEDSLPARDKGEGSSKDKRRIKWLNVACKLILDQTLGLFIMNSTFLVCTNAVGLQSPVLVLQVVKGNIWKIIKAAWKIWPAVSICNFLWVPVESRVLVASLVGFGWNIFLAFFSMAR